MSTFVTPMPAIAAGRAPISVARAARRQLARLGASIWRAKQESGRARARRELLKLAEACEHSQPNLARELHAAVARDPFVGTAPGQS